MAHTLDIDRLKLYTNPDRPLGKKELDDFRPLVKERKSGQPLQYITNQASFMGFTLKIDDRALIPRPETENMTEEILSRFREQKNLTILDLGTGSGAIAIAMARFLVQPKVTAVDKSSDALELAKINAEKNDLGDQIKFLQSDWFSKVSGKFDLIVSNPPYVESSEIVELKPEIKDHEPIEALNGGKEGLREVKHILSRGEEYLTESGAIFLEIGHDQGDKVKDYASSVNLNEIELLEDLQGKDRIIYGRKGE